MGLQNPSTPDTGHVCTFEEIRVGDDLAAASSGTLTKGQRILASCSCGETPRDHLDWAEHTLDYTELAFSALAQSRSLSLYHWSPTSKRKQIIRHGLLPAAARRPTPHHRGERPHICFGDTAAWAWALSGGQRSAPSGTWDLWETRIVDLVDPKILPAPDVSNGIHEIRTEHRVYKRHLWLVGQRAKP